MFNFFREFIKLFQDLCIKSPFVGISIFFILGILVQYIHPFEAINSHILIFFIISTFVCVICSHYIYRGRIVLLLVWFSILGYFCTFQNKQMHVPLFGNKTLTATICSPLVEKSKTCKAEIICANTNGTYSKAILYIAKDSVSKKLKYGDIIHVNASFKEIINRENQSFDYKKFLERKYIYSSSFITSKNWRKVGFKKSLSSISNNIREQIITVLHTTNLSQLDVSLISAIVFGDRTSFDSNISQAFTTAGVSHILSVSGLHVAIVTLILFFVLKILISHKGMQYVVTIFGIWVYAFISGICPSIQRSAIMATMVLISMLLQRRNSLYNSLAFSAFISLLINPLDIFDVGFQLSYLAVIGIAYFNPIISKCLYVSTPIYKYIWEIVAVSISVQIISLPISLFYFGVLPTYSILANVVIIPLSFILLANSLVLLVVWFIPYVSDFIAYTLQVELDFMLNVLFDISSFPKASIPIQVTLSLLTVIYACIIIGIIANEMRKKLIGINLNSH